MPLDFIKRSTTAKSVGLFLNASIWAGKATPGQQIGTALGPHGVNMMEFITQFNEQTRAMGDTVIPVEITVYDDRTFSFITKTPPAANQLLKAAGLEKGSGSAKKDKVGKVTAEQVRAIAENKLVDLNARTIDHAARIIEGTARSMGITVEK